MMKTKLTFAICSLIIMLSTTLINPVTAKSEGGKINFFDAILKEMVKWKDPIRCSSDFNFSIIIWDIIAAILGFLLGFLIWRLPELLHNDQEKSNVYSATPICNN